MAKCFNLRTVSFNWFHFPRFALIATSAKAPTTRYIEFFPFPPPIATMPIHLFFWCANFVVDSGAKACATRWPRIWTTMKLGNHVVAGRLLGMPDSFSTTSTIYALVCFTRASTFISFISGPFGMLLLLFFFLLYFLWGPVCLVPKINQMFLTTPIT